MNKWLTLQDAAKYLGVSKDFVRDMIEDGLPCYKIRRMVFVKTEEIDAEMEKHKL